VVVAVIGSGLSGLACARALIRRGLRPIIVDVGDTIEQPIQGAVDRMKSCEPANWCVDDVELIRRNASVNEPGIPKKLVFGSEYIYARDHAEGRIDGSHKVSISFAKGGFSNAWGAAILPAVDSDMAGDWPITSIDLAPHYHAVMSWLPLSAGADGLARHFPTYVNKHATLALPPQAQSLRRDLANVMDERIAFGQARLAVETAGASGCRYCGLCLSGCVYGSIFNAADDIERLARAGKVEYWPGFMALRIIERDGRVHLVVQRVKDGKNEEFEFDRIFLAAGAINSTRIILHSLDAFDRSVEFKVSQKFVLPIFRRRGQPYQINKMNSLASLFIELRLVELGDNWMHAQISTVSDFLVRRFRADRSRLSAAIVSPLLKRTLIAWGSLHSRHSATLHATLRRRYDRTSFELSEGNLCRARCSISIGVRRLADLASRAHSIVIPRLVSAHATGASNHLGGSLPMRLHPRNAFETDILGKPGGFSAVHVVDSSVMPSIPATTIALLMMANADRIGTEAPLN
jgi:choline dehydrogenase-like flavoprotein